MNRQDATALFQSMYPRFFENASLRDLPEEWIYDEMLLSLREFDPHSYERPLSGGVSFGIYQGELKTLQEEAEIVNPGWGRYFDGSQRIYCGYTDGRPVSFCLISDLGTHLIEGQECRVGGPGCVGTLPAYRDRGIGLTMVRNVTQILRDEGFDYSYIHYTGVAPWYEKLGYRTILRWNKNGVL